MTTAHDSRTFSKEYMPVVAAILSRAGSKTVLDAPSGNGWLRAAVDSNVAIDGVDLHDRGGRVRFKTPDAREFLLELHGRDWPLSEGRESLLLMLTDPGTDETIGSSWTSLGAARVGMDLGWMAIDCAPVVSETGEQRS
jgi:hypothetical protein